MGTEISEQSLSDLCVHRDSAVKAIVLSSQKSRLTTEARWAQRFQKRNFIRPLCSSCLCGESYRAEFAEIQINPGGTMGTEISEEEFYQASVFIVPLR
jgi:hypothetical protein